MKQFLITLISIFTINFAYSQSLIIDAGTDKYICMTSNGISPGSGIGGNPTIISGVPPYQIKWETHQEIGSILFTASDFLNDTTATNPLFIDVGNLQMYFYLTVIDANNQVAKDTVKVSYATYFTLPEPNVQHITNGDTTTISPNLFGGVPPLTYSWSPNYNISDTSSSMPTVWPAQSTTYQCTITDAVGCVNTETLNYATVNVWPVNTNKILKENIKIYPNPTQDLLIVELEESQLKNIKMTDISGKVVLQQLELLNNQLDISALPFGIYILSVEDSEGNIGQFQVLKK